MAINPVNFIVSPSATATNGSDTITVTGSVDCSRVFAGTAVFIGTRHVVEALSGTVPDGSGNSTIKLKENWADPTTTAVLTAIYTPEGLATAINYARDIVANISSIDGLVGTGLIEKTGVDTYSLLQKATTVQAQAGIDDTAYSTSKKVADYVNKYGVGNTIPQTLVDINLSGQVGAGFFCTLGGTASMPLGIFNSTVLNMYRNAAGSTSELDGSQFIIGKDGSNNTRIGARFAWDVEASTVPFIELLHTENFAPVANLISTSDTLPLAASQGPVLAGMIATKLDSNATAVNSLALGGVAAVDYRQKIDKVFDKAGTATIESSAEDATSSASFRADSGGAFISLHSVGNFAFNFGYSTAQSKIGIGGWSLGNNFYEIYHGNNLISAQNLSGATVNSNATTAGSNLSPAQSGTWRNVSGNDILNNGYGLFKRD